MQRGLRDPGARRDRGTGRLGDVVADRDADLAVAERGIRALLGVNGAGGTTLMHARAGLTTADAGLPEAAKYLTTWLDRV
jgi:ABC-type sulfate/molybdate transport systems ATPase subunit